MQLVKKLDKSSTYPLALGALVQLEHRILGAGLTLSEYRRYRDVILYQFDHLSDKHRRKIAVRLARLSSRLPGGDCFALLE